MSNLKKHLKENKAFCILPFNHMHVDTDSNVKVCCVADWNNPLAKDVTDVSMNELWVGEEYQKIRTDMLAGNKVPQCIGCYKLEEENGGGSDRVAHNTWFNAPSDDWQLDIVTGNNTGHPMWVDWRPGRFCNLGCRMCFVGVSSKIADEHKANPLLTEVTGEEWFDTKEWIEDEKTYTHMQELIPYLTTIKIAGGEPFFMPGVIKLLRWCIETGNTHLRLDITTNGTRMQGKVLKWLREFASVDIQFSIDGIGYTNDYIRYGSEWDNISLAYTQYLGMENVTTNLLSTVQVYNLHDIPNVIQFWKDNGSNNNLIMNFVNWPSEFKIDILPQEYKEQIASEIEKVAFDIPQQQLDTFRINAMLAQLREHTEITDDILDSRQRFVKRTRAYDILRKQDINLVSNNLGNLVSEWEEDGKR
jgi:sulfatase maturation enzyme AslB (radical SAM superfamily)|tara:strand:+ start:40 stop:1290 length:1251 start_codon:yes stop_codon:yes gene_type:complete